VLKRSRPLVSRLVKNSVFLQPVCGTGTCRHFRRLQVVENEASRKSHFRRSAVKKSMDALFHHPVSARAAQNKIASPTAGKNILSNFLQRYCSRNRQAVFLRVFSAACAANCFPPEVKQAGRPGSPNPESAAPPMRGGFSSSPIDPAKRPVLRARSAPRPLLTPMARAKEVGDGIAQNLLPTGAEGRGRRVVCLPFTVGRGTARCVGDSTK